MATVDEFVDIFKPLTLELESRQAVSRNIDVVDHKETKHSQRWFSAPGTLTVFITRGREDLLARLKSSITTGDEETVLGIVDSIAAEFNERRQVSLEEAISRTCAESVIAEVRYGGAPMARSLTVPDDLSFSVVTFPDNGGTLETGELTLVQYVNESSSELKSLAIRHHPPLNAAEKAALKAIPAATVGRGTIGTAERCWAWTAVAIAGVVALATSFCTLLPIVIAADDPVVHFTPEEIAGMGPSKTARELLAIRRKALEQSGRRHRKP